MQHESPPPVLQPLYLVKVLAGLLALGLLALAGWMLPIMGLSPAQHQLALVGLLLLALLLVPAIYWVAHRRDELQRLQHHQASAYTLPVLAATAVAVGTLQANGWVPLFNQFWSLGLLLAVWGGQLVWVDRRYR